MIDEKYTWDFSDYFKSDKEWEKSLKEYKSKIMDMAHFSGQLNDRNTIFLCFKKLEELTVMADSLAVYASCLRDLDVTNSNRVSMINKIENAITLHAEQTAFIEPEISALEDSFISKLIEDDRFLPYKRLLEEILREKPHLLSKDQEKLISGIMLFGDDFSTNHSNFDNGDLKFNKVKTKNGTNKELNHHLASLYLKSPDRVLRENTFKEMQGAYGRYNNFLTSNYLAHVKKDTYFSKIRNFNSSLDKALFYENVPSVVYQKLISNVENNLDVDQEYFNLKKKMLVLDKFAISDVYYNPIKLTKKYNFEEAMDKVCDALKLLGNDYVEYIRFMQNNRRIDVFPLPNKRSGAYETMAPTKSPRVLTNFVGTFSDVSTLAHELGHAMHSYYSDKYQTPTNSQYTIFLAEIASTVNETILSQYMIENTKSSKEKLYYVCEYLSEFHATVFRQTMFANFESMIHKKVEKGEDVSTEILNNTYLSLAKKYFGKNVEVFEETKYEWSRIPHFFTSFYVYKYATGIISAINIVEGLKSGKITVEDYKSFLSAGSSKSPCEILKMVKIDLSTEEPYEVAFNYIKSLLKIFKENI